MANPDKQSHVISMLNGFTPAKTPFLCVHLILIAGMLLLLMMLGLFYSPLILRIASRSTNRSEIEVFGSNSSRFFSLKLYDTFTTMLEELN